MDVTRIKHHPIFIYTSIVMVLLVCGFIGVLLILHSIYGIDAIITKRLFAFLFGISFISLGIYFAWLLLNRAPIVHISDREIIIRNKRYPLDEVTDAVLTGKQPFRYLKIFNSPLEGLLLNFKDGTKLYLYDDLYLNLWMLKHIIHTVVLSKQPYKYVNKKEDTWVNYSEREVYKGSSILNFRMIPLCVVSWLTVYAFIKQQEFSGTTLFIFGGLLFWFLLTSWMMHYFEVTNNSLVVRNHILFWRKRYYSLSNIQQVVFESESRQPNAMRIICKNFSGRKYLASSLKDKTWLKLKARLESLGIEVRNEAIYERLLSN